MTVKLNTPAWYALRSSVEKKTLDLLKEHGLEGWKVNFDTATHRAGRCVYSTKIISYSILYVLKSTEETMLNTIRHEVAHAIVGAGNAHNFRWKRTFVKLGGNGERSANGFDATVYTHENFRWIGTCPTCQTAVGQQRAPQSIWACTQCSKDVKSIDRVFTWTKMGAFVPPHEIGLRYAAKYAAIFANKTLTNEK